MDEKYIQQLYADIQSRYGKDKVIPYSDFVSKVTADKSYQRQLHDDISNTYGKDKVIGFDDFTQKLSYQKQQEQSPIPSLSAQTSDLGIKPVGTFDKQPVSHDLPMAKGDIHSLPQVLNTQHPSVQKSDLYLAHPDIHKQAVEDFSFANKEDKQSVLNKIQTGDYVVDDGKVKVKGGFLDNLGQSAINTLKNIKLALDVEGAKANKNTDAEAENEIKYHLNEAQKSNRFDREYAATDLKGQAGQLTGGLLPYVAAGALSGGVADIPAMGLSNMGEKHQEIWNDPTMTEDEKVKAINRMSKDDFMIGALQGAAFHGVGAGEEKATANSLLSKYKPTQKFTQGLYNKLSDLASTTPSDVAKSAGVFGVKELADQLNKSKEGASADFSKVPEALMQGATFHLLMTAPRVITTALGTLAEASKQGVDKTDPQWYNSYSKDTQDALNNIVKAPQPLYEKMMSQLDESKDIDSINAKQKIETFRGYYNSLPEMSDAAKDKALHIIQLKTEAVAQAKAAPEEGIAKIYENKAKAYDGLLQKLVDDGNVDVKKEPLLIDRFRDPKISVVRPEEMNKPEAVTVSPKEYSTEGKSSPSVILPENNKEPNIVPLKTEVNDTGATEPISEPVPTNEALPEEQKTGELLPSTETVGQGDAKSSDAVVLEGKKGDGAGITHADMNKWAEALDLPEHHYEKSPTTREAQNIEAAKRVANGEMPALIEKMKRKEMPTDIEQRMVAYRRSELENEYNSTKSDKTLSEIKDLMDLSNVMGGREVAKSLQARQNRLHPLDEGVASAMVAKMEANNTDKLTDAQKKQVEGLVAEYKKTAENEAAKRKDIEDKYNSFLAEKELETTKKTTPRTKKTKDDFVSERKSLKDQLKEAKDKHLAKMKEQGIQQMGAGGPVLTPEMAKIIWKMAKSHIDEIRTITLPDLVDKTLNEVKDIFSELTDRDIRDVIAGNYNEKKETRNELQAKIYEIRQEQKLLDEYDKALRGEPKTEKATQQKNEKLTELRKKISDLRKGTKIEEDADLKKITAVREANKRAAEKLHERIHNKDFTAKEKPISFIDNADFQRKHPKEYADALHAIQAKEEAKKAFDLAMLKDEMDKRPNTEKAKDFLVKLRNTSTAVVAGVDDSMMFVQLGNTLLSNPKVAVNFRKVEENGKTKYVVGGAIKEHVLDAISKRRFETQMTALHKSAAWPLIKASGLDVLEPTTLLDAKKEELFQHNLAGKIGIGKANLGAFLEIFERAYTSLGNNTRTALFLNKAAELQNKGITYENSPEIYKGVASAINNLTGRGSMNAKIAQGAPLASSIVGIWSPKMLASSINLLGLSEVMGKKGGFYTKMPPEARKYAISQMSRGIGIGIGVMAAAAIGGHTVHADPRDVRFGDVEYDDGKKAFNVFGRFSSVIKIVAQMLPFVGGIKKDGQVTSIYDTGGKTGMQEIGGFFRGKMNPLHGLGYDYLLNDKTDYFSKKPITGAKAAEALGVPMALRNVGDILKKDGSMNLLEFAANFTGISMKNQMDYYENQWKGKPEGDFLQQRMIKVPTTNTELMKVDKSSANPKGRKMTDEEADKFTKAKDDIMQKEIAKVMKHGWYNEKGEKISPSAIGNPENKTALEEAVKVISERATTEARKKIFKEEEKDPYEAKDKRLSQKMKEELLED